MLSYFADHDECATSLHGCQHSCNNLNGSFFCSCNAGYVLNKDNKTCSGVTFLLLSGVLYSRIFLFSVTHVR